MGLLTLSGVTQRRFILGRQGLYAGRRWRGYYTLPILYQETLVARADLRLERDTKTLVVKGFWLENHIEASAPFITALARGFKRFMQFVEAEQLDGTALSRVSLRERVEQVLQEL